MSEKTHSPSIAVIDGELVQKQIERFDAAIQRLDQLPDQLDGFVKQLLFLMDDLLNLHTYSIQQASTATGIGYKKLSTACKAGVLPFFSVGNKSRIKHADLYRFIETQRMK